MERRPILPKHAAAHPLPAIAPNGRAHFPDHAHGAIGLPPDDSHLDPDLRAYLRAPYDPLKCAQATRFFAGELLRHPPAHGWMRVLAFLLALGLLGLFLMGVAAIVGLFADGDGAQALVIGAQFVLLACLLGLFGAVLLWRLLRHWGDSSPV